VQVVDEYLALRVLFGVRPPELDDDEPLALPAYRHYRLLQRIHQPGDGQLSRLLAEADQQAIRRPHPEVLQILDPRPLLDEAAAIGARYRAAGLLVGETLAAGLTFGRTLWFGTERNVGMRLSEIAQTSGSRSTSSSRAVALENCACTNTIPTPGGAAPLSDLRHLTEESLTCVSQLRFGVRSVVAPFARIRRRR
jgi:hypothetical protein